MADYENPHSVHEREAVEAIRRESYEDVYGGGPQPGPLFGIPGWLWGAIAFVLFWALSLGAIIITLPR